MIACQKHTAKMTDPLRDYVIARYGLDSSKHRFRDLPEELLLQLWDCQSEMARRLLLGCSEKFAPGELRQDPEIQPIVVRASRPRRVVNVDRMLELAAKVAA